jgi:peptidoglycan/LPS O-acetylase OafA/YrhL
LLWLGLVLYGVRYTLALAVPLPNEDLLAIFCAMGSVVIIALTLRAPTLQKFLLRPGLNHLGRISYSIYLCHFALLLCFTPRFLQLLNAGGWTGGTAWVTGFVATTLLTWIVSTWLYRFVEMPALRLAKRWAAR